MTVCADKYVSRKFLLHVAVFAVATVALFLGFLSGSEWVTAAVGAGGSYGVSNAAWQYATARAPEPSGWQPNRRADGGA